MFQLLKETTRSKARRGEFTTSHGVVPTPVFMPVGTQATIKATDHLRLAHTHQIPVILGNTYHLYLRPGTEIIAQAGGLHRFMNRNGAILTDSGGYQVFSLADRRKIDSDGVVFKSHLDGSSHRFTPENVIDIQRQLGSDIMMVLDECPPYPCEMSYLKESLDLTHRWAARCLDAFNRTEPHYGHHQALFAITQGGTNAKYRRESAMVLSQLGTDGMAIGGLSVGEPNELMYEMTDISTDVLPADRPRYLMGVGTPADLLESVARGIDMFDCVMPTRNARNGMLFTRNGIINIKNARWKHCFESADPGFESELCQNHSLAYLHHLFRAGEIFGLMLASEHNVSFYVWLMEQARKHIEDDTYDPWYSQMAARVMRRL